MDDLISRQAAIEYIRLQKWRRFTGMTIEEAIVTMLKEVRTEGPREVEWAVYMNRNIGECCGCHYSTDRWCDNSGWEYCPKCGARIIEKKFVI